MGFCSSRKDCSCVLLWEYSGEQGQRAPKMQHHTDSRAFLSSGQSLQLCINGQGKATMSDSPWPHLRAYVVSLFSHIQLLASLWTVAHRAPLSWDSPGENTGVGCHALLQGTVLTKGSNLCLLLLLQCRQILYRWATGEAHDHTWPVKNAVKFMGCQGPLPVPFPSLWRGAVWPGSLFTCKHTLFLTS